MVGRPDLPDAGFPSTTMRSSTPSRQPHAGTTSVESPRGVVAGEGSPTERPALPRRRDLPKVVVGGGELLKIPPGRVSENVAMQSVFVFEEG